MKHDVVLTGYAFRLRPVDDGDVDFIIHLRARSAFNVYLHSIVAVPEAQLQWLAEYYRRMNDYYFVLESLVDGRREGLVAIYDIEPTRGVGEWGRWILRPDSVGAVECAWLVYCCAFDRLHLNEVYCRTVVANERVISFHDSCGLTRKSRLKGFFFTQDAVFDGIEHRLNKDEWLLLEPRLSLLSRQLAARIDNARS